MVTEITQPTNGTATPVAGGISFTPNGIYTGSDSFSYTVSDGQGGTANATVTLTNAIPVAPSNTYHLPISGGVVEIDVLPSATDADNDPLTISTVGTPAKGTAAIVGNKVE